MLTPNKHKEARIILQRKKWALSEARWSEGGGIYLSEPAVRSSIGLRRYEGGF